MLNSGDLQIVQIFKKRLRSITQIKKMIVFGSRARGDSTNESDLDVFIEIQKISPELRQRISETAWEVGFDNNLVISFFLVS